MKKYCFVIDFDDKLSYYYDTLSLSSSNSKGFGI